MKQKQPTDTTLQKKTHLFKSGHLWFLVVDHSLFSQYNLTYGTSARTGDRWFRNDSHHLYLFMHP